MQAYLDNSATTPVEPAVAELMLKLMTEDFGNPSSMHRKGFEAETQVRNAAEELAKIWKCTPNEIIFTSGGTESDNMALLGAAKSRVRYGKHIITTKVEHAAILSTCEELKNQGYEISYLNVDNNGIIDLDELKQTIRQDTILVSIMHVNNEIGSVMPIAEAGKLIKEINPECLFHVDDIQGFGKLRLIPDKARVDMISISAHKLHGPKGAGALYVSKNTRIKPIIFGGGQQRGMRSGTENVPGIVGLSKAAVILNEKLEENTERLYELRDYFIDRLKRIEGVQINSGNVSRQYSAPHIVSMSVEKVRAEVLLHSLEDKGIYVSAGSACSSNKPHISETLKAIGLKQDLLDNTVRFSFSIHTTREELDYTAEQLESILPMLQRFTRK